MSRRPELPSLTALAAFEAAARRGSFKLAAQEINVTAAAISHQVKALERELGCTLFHRLHRGVELTGKGRFLAEAVRGGFDAIAAAANDIRARADAVDVTISATTAVSALWLTPRITAFWRTHPTITVSQQVSDVPGGGVRTDLSITYCEPQGPPADERVLFRDRILALAAPGFAAEHGINSLADLRQAPLIHSSPEETGWTTWEQWFGLLGHDGAHGRRFRVNNYMIGLIAAQDGVGAILGWERLVSGLVAEGKLAPLLPDAVPSPMPFALQVHPQASAKARLFAEWLVASA